MKEYFRTVTLGAFSWKNEERIALFFANVHKQNSFYLLLHFFIITICINFPVTFIITRLAPFELGSRIYGEDFLKSEKHENETEQSRVDDFNALMYENNYGRNTLLPLLGVAFILTLVIQAVFYLCAAFFLSVARMNVSALSFHDRFGLAVFSSTLPAPAASIFGLFLPTVHFIVFYFIVIFIIFQRSKLCPNG